VKKNDFVLKRKGRIVIVGTILLILVFSPQGIQMYDEFADQMADPGYLGEGSPVYVGGWYDFSVSADYPKTKVVVNFNTSVHDYNKTFYPDSDDWPEGFSCRAYWSVNERIGPDEFERVRISMYWFVPRFDVEEVPFWELVVYDSWLSEPEYYDPVSDLTLYFDWHGWI